MNWLEVSLIVEDELAEPVAEVLARFAPNGVVIESTAIQDSLENEGHPIGPLRVCAYLPADEKTEDTCHRIEESLWYLGRIRTIPPPVFKPIQETNWSEAWKKNYRPIPVGKNLIIIPAWLDSYNENRIPIRIDPGMAFGTGTHPTTQLCLEVLEDYVIPGETILDIGCGSGILSIAGIKLGARRACGVDIDPDAIDSAVSNAVINGVGSQTFFAQGSVDEIMAGIFEVRQASLVFANILAYILKRLMDGGLADLLRPGGVLILSGLLEEQIPEMSAKIVTHGLKIIDQRQKDDWVALAIRRLDLPGSTV